MRETILLLVFMSLLTAFTVQPIVGGWCEALPCSDERPGREELQRGGRSLRGTSGAQAAPPAPTASAERALPAGEESPSSEALRSLLLLALDDGGSPISARERLRAEAAVIDRTW